MALDDLDGIANVAFTVQEDFHPSDVAGYTWHVDASELSLSDGDPVSTWPDQAGSNDATAPSSSEEPTYRTGQQNGEPWVEFDGSDDRLNLGSRQNFLHDGSTGWTIFVAFEILTVNTAFIYGSGGFSSSVLGGGLVINGGNIDGHDRISDGGGFVNPAQTDGYAGLDTFGVATRKHVVDDAIYGYTDGNTEYTSSIGSSYNSSTADNPPALGNRANGDNDPIHAGFGEVIVYNQAVSDSDRQDIETYLMDKYGVTA